jgi:hypothetical protein
MSNDANWRPLVLTCVLMLCLTILGRAAPAYSEPPVGLVVSKRVMGHRAEINLYCGAKANLRSVRPTVSVSDSYGNFTPRLGAYSGQAFDMMKDRSGDVLQLSATRATSPSEVEIRNKLMVGSINANYYLKNKLVVRIGPLAPGQKAVFVLQCFQGVLGTPAMPSGR